MFVAVRKGRVSPATLVLLACTSPLAGCGDDRGAGQDGGGDRVRFELGSTNNGESLVFTPPFYFETDTAALAQAARDAIGRDLFVNGCITQELAPYNDPFAVEFQDAVRRRSRVLMLLSQRPQKRRLGRGHSSHPVV